MDKEKNKKNKDERLGIRLSNDDLKMIKKKSTKMKLSSSELIRRMVKYGVCYRIDFDSAEDILRELGKIGNNINQITRGLNTSIIMGTPFELNQIRQLLDKYYDDLHAIQLTCEEYFQNNSVKKLEKITIDISDYD